MVVRRLVAPGDENVVDTLLPAIVAVRPAERAGGDHPLVEPRAAGADAPALEPGACS